MWSSFVHKIIIAIIILGIWEVFLFELTKKIFPDENCLDFLRFLSDIIFAFVTFEILFRWCRSKHQGEIRQIKIATSSPTRPLTNTWVTRSRAPQPMWSLLFLWICLSNWKRWQTVSFSLSSLFLADRCPSDDPLHLSHRRQSHHPAAPDCSHSGSYGEGCLWGVLQVP